MASMKQIVITEKEMYRIIQNHLDKTIQDNPNRVIGVEKRNSDFWRNQREFVINLESGEFSNKK